MESAMKQSKQQVKKTNLSFLHGLQEERR